MDFQLPSQQLQVLLFDKSKVCHGTPRSRPLCHLLHRATRLVIPGCYHTHGGLGDVENCNLLTDTQIDTKLPTPCLEMGRDTLVGLDTGYNGIHWCPTPCLTTWGSTPPFLQRIMAKASLAQQSANYFSPQACLVRFISNSN